MKSDVLPRILSFAFLAAGLTAVVPADATVITYPNFSSTAGLMFGGNATTATTSDGAVLRVTPATYNQAGSVRRPPGFQ